MNSWRVVLQLEDAGGRSQCTRYDLAGVVRPARIFIIGCDPSVTSSAAAVHAAIDRQLRTLGATPFHCGPIRDNCITWKEPSCQHVFVLIMGAAPLDRGFETRAADWRKKSRDAIILPALAPGLNHAQVFDPPHAFRLLSKCAVAPWGGSASVLATSALTAATLDERPGVFLSYRRDDAAAGADVLHDRLTHGGFRVFVDRFAGTPGRPFPQELAEAMASMGLVVLLETQRFHQSHWSMWEAAFARRYRLGPIAINFRSAPAVSGAIARDWCPADPKTPLPQTHADRIFDFIRDQHVRCAILRRSYYESLVELSARQRGGSTRSGAYGVLTISDSTGATKACALPHGIPGRLRHVHRVVASGVGGGRIMAGEHQHLPPADRDDLKWLAAANTVTLTGSASVYRLVQTLLP